jgi:hypothetical protein
MMLSKLAAKLESAGDLHAYSAYLAEPDSDGQDVDLATIGRVEINEQTAEARLYPSSTSLDLDEVDPEPYLGMVLDQLPLLDSVESDLRLVAEVPLLRGEAADDKVHLADIVDICVGREAQEVWFLLRPAADFADGLLPT